MGYMCRKQKNWGTPKKFKNSIFSFLSAFFKGSPYLDNFNISELIFCIWGFSRWETRYRRYFSILTKDVPPFSGVKTILMTFLWVLQDLFL